MAYSPASANNTFVPSHETSGALLLGYSRNPDKFPVMRYVQVNKVSKREFYLLNWASQEGARIRSTNDNEHLWNDGQDAPTGVDETEGHEYQLFGTQRRIYPFTVGWLAIEQADWNVLSAYGAVAAQKAMTARSLLTYNALNSASFPTATATTLSGPSGGKFSAGTPSTPFARLGLNSAAVVINQQTMGTVGVKDLMIVMNPNTAKGIAASQEVTDYAKFVAGPAALAGLDPLPAFNYGLPRILFGYETCVDDTIINTTAKGATQTFTYIIPDGTIFMISKQGGLEGVPNGGTWSTVQMYAYEEFTVEQMDDVNNRLTRGRVISDYVIVIPDQATKSGYKITAAI